MLIASRSMRLAVCLLVLVACGGSPAEPVRGPSPESDAPPSSTSPTPAPSDEGPTCIMLYECGCNARCVSIELPKSKLHEGVETKVRAGDLANERVFVRENANAGGVFTVQRSDPRPGVEVCARTVRSPLLGYLCSTKDSGPPRACAVCGP